MRIFLFKGSRANSVTNPMCGVLRLGRLNDVKVPPLLHAFMMLWRNLVFTVRKTVFIGLFFLNGTRMNPDARGCVLRSKVKTPMRHIF